jgi:hypothetical protein
MGTGSARIPEVQLPLRRKLRPIATASCHSIVLVKFRAIMYGSTRRMYGIWDYTPSTALPARKLRLRSSASLQSKARDLLWPVEPSEDVTEC